MSHPILIIHSNADAGDLYKVVLESASMGYQCLVVSSLEEARHQLEKESYRTLLIDDDVIDSKRWSVWAKLRMKNIHTRMIVLSQEPDANFVASARENGIDQLCLKNDEYPELINAIEGVIE